MLSNSHSDYIAEYKSVTNGIKTIRNETRAIRHLSCKYKEMRNQILIHFDIITQDALNVCPFISSGSILIQCQIHFARPFH